MHFIGKLRKRMFWQVVYHVLETQGYYIAINDVVCPAAGNPFRGSVIMQNPVEAVS